MIGIDSRKCFNFFMVMSLRFCNFFVKHFQQALGESHVQGNGSDHVFKGGLQLDGIFLCADQGDLRGGLDELIEGFLLGGGEKMVIPEGLGRQEMMAPLLEPREKGLWIANGREGIEGFGYR